MGSGITIRAEGTFPQILSGTAIKVDPGTAITREVTMPTGTQIGDLIIVFAAKNSSSIDEFFTIDTAVSGNNWTIVDATGSSTVAAAVVWKIAEGSDALTLLTASYRRGTFIAYRISLFNTSNPVTITITEDGNSTNANPPANTPAYGMGNYLFMVFAATTNYVAATAAPANFTDLLTQIGSSTGAGTCSIAVRRFKTDSELDPGVFTTAYSLWATYNVIINPIPQAV